MQVQVQVQVQHLEGVLQGGLVHAQLLRPRAAPRDPDPGPERANICKSINFFIVLASIYSFVLNRIYNKNKSLHSLSLLYLHKYYS